MIKRLLIGIALIFITAFFYFTHIDIKCALSKDKKQFIPINLPFSSHSSAHTYWYRCILKSKIPQKVRLHIIVDDEIVAIYLNNKALDLASIKERYHLKKLNDYRYGYEFDMNLQKGSNTLLITTRNYGGPYGIAITQKLLWWQALLAITALITIFAFLYLKLYDKIISFFTSFNYAKLLSYTPLFILCIGILLRFIYVLVSNQYSYAHDLYGHKALIEYYTHHFFSFPLPEKGLEYPQQPLYYWISALIYKAAQTFNFSKESIFSLLRWVAFIYSIGWLLFGFLVAKRLFLQSTFLRSIFMLFLATTPYFIFLSGQINNDTLNAFLGMASFYAIISYAQHPLKKFFTLATLFISLATLTKISSLLWALYFVFIIFTTDRATAKKRLLIFSSTILLLFLWTLWRVYIPFNGFHFVNSARYANQTITSIDIFYLFSFHPFELLHQAHSYIFGNDTIRFSLPTYLFGTMIFGEYNFAHIFSHPLFKLLSQLIILLSFSYIVGFISYFLFFKRLNFLYKSLLIPFLINFALILKFLIAFPSVCNSDFRYFSPTYGVIAAIFIIGIFHLTQKYRWTKRVFIFAFTLLFLTQTVWLAELFLFNF